MSTNVSSSYNKDFINNISSFQIKETGVIIVPDGGFVETWTSIWNADTNAHTWESVPKSTMSDILNLIFEPDVPGFGKKVYDIGMYLIIASDEGVFSYSTKPTGLQICPGYRTTVGRMPLVSMSIVSRPVLPSTMTILLPSMT